MPVRLTGTTVSYNYSGSLISGTGAHTLAIWLNIESLAAIGVPCALSIDPAGTGPIDSAFDDACWVGVSAGGSIKFLNRAASTGTPYSYTHGSYTLASWVHLAMTYDGTTCRAYVNGALVNSATASFTGRAASTLLYVGSGDTFSFANAQLHSRALTDSEVKNVMRGAQLGGSEAYYPMHGRLGAASVAEVIDDWSDKRRNFNGVSGTLSGIVTQPNGLMFTRGFRGNIIRPNYTAVALAAVMASSSAFTGAMNASKPLAGTMASDSALAGTLSVSIPLAGTMASSSDLSGSAIQTQALAGTMASSSALSGALNTSKPLVGTMASDSAFTASLNTSKPVAAVMASSSVLSGSLGQQQPIAGALASSSALSGALNTLKPLAGAMASSSLLSGDMIQAQALAGAMASDSAFVAFLNVPGAFVGTMASNSTLSGTLGLAQPVASTMASDSALAGTLTARVYGQMASDSAFSGALALLTSPIAGALSSDSALNGNLTQVIAISSTMASSSSLSGTPTALISGQLTSDSSFTGSLAQSQALTGAMDSASAFTGSLTGGTPVAGGGGNLDTNARRRLALQAGRRKIRY